MNTRMETKQVNNHKSDLWICGSHNYGILKTSLSLKIFIQKLKKIGSNSLLYDGQKNMNLTVIKIILDDLSINPKNCIFEYNLQGKEITVKDTLDLRTQNYRGGGAAGPIRPCRLDIGFCT